MKFKGIKKKTYNKKSPSNSRNITDQSMLSWLKVDPALLIRLYGVILKTFVVIVFLVASIIVGLDIKGNLQLQREIDSQRAAIAHDLNFWEDFIFQHSNYPDAYFQAAILQYRLGDISRARQYVEKGLSLNPNSIGGKSLEQLLTEK